MTMMFMIMSFMFLSMFVYVNSLYYTMILLMIVLSLLYILVSNLMLTTLTMLMMAIVYIGAMMILIGYICAICPNLILSPSYYSSFMMFIFLILPFLFMSFDVSFLLSNSFIPMVSYFYNYSGVLVFSVLVLMLFITLLMVTSQYMAPKGPFRSLTF